MRVKNKRVLKNGAVAGYVYYSNEKKWKWRIIKGPNKKRGGNLLPNNQKSINSELDANKKTKQQNGINLGLIKTGKHKIMDKKIKKLKETIKLLKETQLLIIDERVLELINDRNINEDMYKAGLKYINHYIININSFKNQLSTNKKNKLQEIYKNLYYLNNINKNSSKGTYEPPTNL